MLGAMPDTSSFFDGLGLGAAMEASTSSQFTTPSSVMPQALASFGTTPFAPSSVTTSNSAAMPQQTYWNTGMPTVPETGGLSTMPAPPALTPLADLGNFGYAPVESSGSGQYVAPQAENSDEYWNALIDGKSRSERRKRSTCTRHAPTDASSKVS